MIGCAPSEQTIFMATGTVSQTNLPPPPPLPAESLQRERLIRRQLGRTSWHVRLVDLASSLAVWAVSVLGLMLAAALFDHTLGLGIAGRLLVFSALLSGTIYYVVVRVAPLLMRSINPTYAARTIQEA